MHAAGTSNSPTEWRGRWSRFRRILPLLSFAAGVTSFLLVERGAAVAQWVMAGLLLGWLFLLLEAPLTRLIGIGINPQYAPGILRAGTQSLHQEALFFTLPFFFAATDWYSAQAAFTLLLIAAATASVIDPVYFNVIGRRRWLLVSMHAFVVFAALLTALPIAFSLDTEQSLIIATVLLAISLAAGISGMRRGKLALGPLVAIGIAICIGLSLWAVRENIPASTFQLTEAYVSDAKSPGDRAGASRSSVISTEQLRSQGIYAFTSVSAPLGVNEPVFHVWTHEGREVDRIPLKVKGGREAGFRFWSHKRNFPEQPQGEWQVSVVTASGQRIGQFHFRVTA